MLAPPGLSAEKRGLLRRLGQPSIHWQQCNDSIVIEVDLLQKDARPDVIIRQKIIHFRSPHHAFDIPLHGNIDATKASWTIRGLFLTIRCPIVGHPKVWPSLTCVGDKTLGITAIDVESTSTFAGSEASSSIQGGGGLYRRSPWSWLASWCRICPVRYPWRCLGKEGGTR
ncbi:unnamed protein product [Vitrella brassicaformis CCMP3155]|uniref:CS domain-containing protein n=2 Tax=Vitrella brassicaformis TaxID=1169539 RepID=A0A0G4GK62_VITBC|nr:unnamed protein product [Vitrella brassicaformis CCMP3155]|mmetsp:Transcript_7599/g.18584  ORF Transcript_7599/g.18584 Transcript_7599/m.18584 type:complete len:170 (+) Transcript_7599:156-665(+)|eukprot:CEM30287.1 unnamed protein product [Vitrella brassicaformis CCMP3155]